jgi:hypothetical protein
VTGTCTPPRSSRQLARGDLVDAAGDDQQPLAAAAPGPRPDAVRRSSAGDDGLDRRGVDMAGDRREREQRER